MKQIVHIEGMTCQGCAANVEEAIAQLPVVETVKANPKTGIVEILHQSTLQTDDIKAVLPPKYALVDNPSTAPSKVKQLFPLGLIFVFLIGGTTIIHYPILRQRQFYPTLWVCFLWCFRFLSFSTLRGFNKALGDMTRWPNPFLYMAWYIRL
jgi:copper chaperone CopZ